MEKMAKENIFTKLFGGLKMGWLTVIIFALIVGIYTGAMLIIPATEGTSFRDIGITHEFWLIFAFIIASNCKKNWESALKTFVFFLISQPVIFLIEISFGYLSLDMAWYYLTGVWGITILMTLPGGLIAYYIKKQNALGAIILGLGCTIQAFLGVHYAIQVANNFPFHLLTCIICFASIIIMIFAIQKQNKYRALAFAIVIIISAALVSYAVINGLTL